MIGRRARWFAGATVLAAVLAAWLLRHEKAEPAPTPAKVTAPTHAGELPRSAAQPTPPEPRKPEATAARPAHSDAKSLTMLAESSDDPRVIVATLEALGTAYAARSTRKPAPDADLERVLVKHLASEDDAIRKAALATSRISLLTEEPQEGVVESLVALTGKDEPSSRRIAGLEALNFLRPDRRGGNVLHAFEAALTAEEPAIVSQGLLALSQSGASLENAPETTRATLSERIFALLGHGNPGVRGRALLVLAELPFLAEEKQRFDAGKRALLDRDPYVCAQAADLLSRVGKAAAIHSLIELVMDLRAARYELRYGAGVVLHEVPGRRTVAEAVLFAVKRLGEAQSGLEPLVLTMRDRYTNDTSIAENAGAARAWYSRNQAKIAREP